MNKINLVAFAVGAAIGSVLTWGYAKKKYEKIAQEEIDSVKAEFSKERKPVQQDIAPKVRLTEPVKNDTDTDIRKALQSYRGEPIKKEVKKVDGPYVIPPEEFGEFGDYEKISLTYYADHILTDDDDDLVEDVNETVGFESLSHFGEYEDDSVFVRNDARKCDYEILLDQRRYRDVMKMRPHREV